MAAPIQADDGNLYGTSTTTVFKAGLDGSFETIYDFCTLPSCADGNWALDPLIQATDGNLYVTTSKGGASDAGAVFSITTGGTLTTLYNFCSLPGGCSAGDSPVGPLFQATDGNLYGMAQDAIYRFSMGLGPFVSPLPAYGSAGGSITILGYNLAGATAVTFNGAPAASFAVNSTSTAITATVPSGATSGSIQVTLSDGSVLSSNVPLQVNP